MSSGTVRVISCDERFRNTAEEFLKKNGFEVCNGESERSAPISEGAAASPALPVILYASSNSPEEITAMQTSIPHGAPAIVVGDLASVPANGHQPFDAFTEPVEWPRLLRSLQHALTVSRLQAELRQLREDRSHSHASDGQPLIPILPEAGLSLPQLERDVLARALQKFRGNQTRTARYLHISRRTLIYRIGKYKLRSLPVMPAEQIEQ